MKLFRVYYPSELNFTTQRMLKNLLITSLRSIRKDKAYSFLNILGLTIGITCSLFLIMYILDELSFDRYHKNAHSIYRIVSNIKEPDNAFTWAVAQEPMAVELRENYPEVLNAVRFNGIGKTLYKHGNKEFNETDFYTADSTVFEMFSYKFIAGDPSTALDKPFSIVLTRKAAKKYFNEVTEALGQSLQTINSDGKIEDFKITGIMEDVPLNSHFRFDALISSNTYPNGQPNWGGFGVFTYILLPEGYDLSKMYKSFDKIVKEKVNPIFEQYGISVKYELQKITDIHLYSKIQDEAEAGGDISYIYIFTAVAAFMLIIACINYMNLATARSTNRSKEVGLRKVMGSSRGKLVLQFVTESIVIASISLLLSFVLIYLLLPSFNTLANKQLPYSYILQPLVLLSLLGMILFIGIVGGSYPAFYLSSFNPVQVLKGKIASKGGNALFRRALVVLQFGISIFMLISTLVVYDQLQFLRTKDLGFVKERVVKLNLTEREMRKNADVLINGLKQNSQVVAVGMANASPGEGISKNLLKVEDNDGKFSDRGIDLYTADFDFVKTLGMKIAAGRDFSRDITSDTLNAVLVNEAMVARMGWKEPLGKKFRFQTGDPKNPTQDKQVVGVVKDYHQNSLYDAIEPLLIIFSKRNNYVFVRTEEGNPKQNLAAIEKTWNQVFPTFPFEYVFLDQDFNFQYKSDEKRSQIFTVFSGLTIFIACLGLLGLASFSTQQRSKEIGIRKVIGAQVQSLIYLVSKEFFLLVTIGIALAFPIAWYFTNSWLNNFAYHIELLAEWPTFIVSAVLGLFITLLTVGFHVVKAAVANPVNTLRDE